MSNQRLSFEDQIVFECSNILRTAKDVADRLGIDINQALLLLILRELVILNGQIGNFLIR